MPWFDWWVEVVEVEALTAAVMPEGAVVEEDMLKRSFLRRRLVRHRP